MAESRALEVLFPGRRRLILAAMFGEPDRWWSLGDLAGRAGVQPASLRQQLAHLRDGGLIREKLENGRWFQADTASPVYPELHAMVSKLTNVADAAETILVVEDQPATAQITRILLESWGYRVMEARGGEEAVELFERHADDIQLLITDVIMPGMSGPQLAGLLQRRRPGLRVVFMSGYPSDQLERAAAFLPKPFNPSSLSRIVRKELDRSEVRRGTVREMKSR